jgi:hypothetical protein
LHIQDLETAMQKAGPDRGEVKRRAPAGAEALEKWRQELRDAKYDRAKLRSLLQALAGQDQAALTWDAAEQTYLALAALDQSYPPNPSRRDALQKMAKLLAFPPPYDSPKGTWRRDQTPEEFGNLLKGVRE